MKTIPINTPEDFECVACEIFDDFLSTFTHKAGLRRRWNKEDTQFEKGEVGFMYTQRGNQLAIRMRDRLKKLGNKKFPGAYIDVRSNLYIEA